MEKSQLIAVHPFGRSRSKAYASARYSPTLPEAGANAKLLERLVDLWNSGDGRTPTAVGFARVRGRGSGIELDQPAAGLVEFRDERLLRLQIFLSEAEALQAAASVA